ncbi:MAG TPA: lysylphosphatidylglycerol synthase transmembrane domain-containing protein [Dehalococcoidia bacterium]|nr:lysylphosphatidylglycerol synthase transmembrane domain-containing protein [Dehalococcoidia bacterium]
MAKLEEEAQVERPASEEPSLRKQFFRLRTLLAFAASAVIIYLVVSRMNIDLAKTWEIIARVDPARLALAMVIYYSAFPIRGLRWRLLFKNVGFDEGGNRELPSSWTLARLMAMGWFANCILPAKLGDAYRAFLAKREMGTSFSKTAGTVLAERVIDIMIVFGLLALASLAVLNSIQSEVAVNIMRVGVALVAVMSVGLVGMARFGGFFQKLLPQRFQGVYQLFHEGTFHSFRNLPVIGLLSVAVWLAEAGRVYLVAWSLGFTLAPGLALFAALTDALLVGIPFVPGGLGLVEAGLIGVLMLAPGVTGEEAASMALLDRSLSYWSILVLGALMHLWGFRGLRARRARLYASD